MPYEIAAEYVRTLMLHYKGLLDAEAVYDSHVAHDLEEKKEATKKAKRDLKMKSAKRYIVMNRRTGQLATQEWVSKNISINSEAYHRSNVERKFLRGSCFWGLMCAMEISSNSSGSGT